MASRRGSRDLWLSLAVGLVVGFALPAATILDLQRGNAVPWDPLPDRPGATWVWIEPTQCLSNPWEEDWLRSNNATLGDYPREWPAQREIIIDYYAKWRIDIIDARRDVLENAVRCAACSCGAGYLLYLQVASENVSSMVSRGFEVVP